MSVPNGSVFLAVIFSYSCNAWHSLLVGKQGGYLAESLVAFSSIIMIYLMFGHSDDTKLSHLLNYVL